MTHEDTARLLDAILSLKTREELQRFFEDLCTIQEINSMAQRYEVAQYLDQGLTYAQIAEITHASTATISRVNRSLVYGRRATKWRFRARVIKKKRHDDGFNSIEPYAAAGRGNPGRPASYSGGRWQRQNTSRSLTALPI